ncbi:MAG: endolytic transglycosylase MltG [Chloroflexi bacterium]|nr:endolytic transglycosylase MltG [Chloroflexota bacterium]
MRLLTIAAVVVALGLTGAAAWQMWESPNVIEEPSPSAAPPETGEPIVVSINPGESAQAIGDRLEEMGVIDSSVQFRVLVALLGYDQMMQAGDYEFDPGTPTLEAVRRIRHGLVSSLVLAVPEGWRLGEIAEAAEAEGIAGAEEIRLAAVAGFYQFDVLSELAPSASLEGYLFPATYFFRRSDTAADVVRAMVKTTEETFTPELRQEAANAGLSVHTVLTLASIVEREAKKPAERPVIAQVFLKRLRLGMALEADPTVQYAVAEDPSSVAKYGWWKKELTLQDLAADSPYNTYRNSGLPPGPIASPGLDSILAVIRPADTNYLFFVAKPNGSHAFAETYDEHQANVDKYQR